MSALPDTIMARRGYFPRGLVQPEDGFRFSADALLLACFAGIRQPRQVLDMGTGCGVIGLGLLMQYPSAPFSVLGVDHDAAMIRTAQRNAAALGFDHRFSAVRADVRDIEKTRGFLPKRYDLVLSNPPYRLKGQGRMPLGGSRQSARFETSARTEDFIRAAAKALEDKGRLTLVHLPEHLRRIFTALAENRLEPKRLRFVHAHAHKPASLLLVEARQAVRPGLHVEPPLVLYQSASQGYFLTRQAQAFCPFLACNAFRPARKGQGTDLPTGND